MGSSSMAARSARCGSMFGGACPTLRTPRCEGSPSVRGSSPASRKFGRDLPPDRGLPAVHAGGADRRPRRPRGCHLEFTGSLVPRTCTCTVEAGLPALSPPVLEHLRCARSALCGAGLPRGRESSEYYTQELLAAGRRCARGARPRLLGPPQAHGYVRDGRGGVHGAARSDGQFGTRRSLRCPS